MASYNGGSLNNNKNGTIVLGTHTGTQQDTLYKNNIGMYGSGDGTKVSLENKGKIVIYSNHSVAMKNDFSGGVFLTNDGTITIERSATDSTVFGGYYSTIVNNYIINYNTTSKAEAEEIATKGTAANPFLNYKLVIKANVMTTKNAAYDGESSEGSDPSSTTEEAYNEEDATININGSSFTSAMSVETTQGKAVNKGYIIIEENNDENESQSVGMFLGDSTSNFASITNEGEIQTNSFMSATMASASSGRASLINDGIINMKKEYSIGIYADSAGSEGENYTIIRNKKTIKTDESYHIGNVAAVIMGGHSSFYNDEGANILVGDSSSRNIFGIHRILNRRSMPSGLLTLEGQERKSS